jgi:hypothetical protein
MIEPAFYFWFWDSLLKESKNKTSLFSRVKPGKRHYLSSGAGRTGLAYVYALRKDQAEVDLYINSQDKHLNRAIFDELFKQREVIEKAFGEKLVWNRNWNDQASIIQKLFVVDNSDDWSKLQLEMLDSMIRLEKALRGRF